MAGPTTRTPVGPARSMRQRAIGSGRCSASTRNELLAISPSGVTSNSVALEPLVDHERELHVEAVRGPAERGLDGRRVGQQRGPGSFLSVRSRTPVKVVERGDRLDDDQRTARDLQEGLDVGARIGLGVEVGAGRGHEICPCLLVRGEHPCRAVRPDADVDLPRVFAGFVPDPPDDRPLDPGDGEPARASPVRPAPGPRAAARWPPPRR